jgi:hypothetical protein
MYAISEVKNTCKLKLHIPVKNFLNKVFSQLSQKYEVAGTIYCDESNNPVHIDINKGEAESVYTPNNVINFHTHPISAYKGGDTVWGWPSGEDIRETIKFGLSGNKAHLVFTVEGLYTIQVNPCKLKKMKEKLNDEERGILIFMIEEYFKTTHNFRCVEEVNQLAKNKIVITPYSFIDFANSFTLNNIISNNLKIYKETECESISNVGHTGIHSEENNNIMKYSGLDKNEMFNKIPYHGFPEISGGFIKCVSAKENIESFDDLRKINEFGKENHFSKPSQLIKKYQQIANHIDGINKCTNVWNNKNANKWFFINFFPSIYYVQKGYLNKGVYTTPHVKFMKQITLNHEPFIRIFSNQKEGCTVSSISKNNNFKTKFQINFSKQNYSFGYTLPSMNKLCQLFKAVTALLLKNKKVTEKSIKVKGVSSSEINNFYRALTR